MAKAWPSAKGIDGRLLFLDLETTGLFGGAGTQAFLVGCAAIEGTSIRVRQFLMPGFEHERALLGELQRVGGSRTARSAPSTAAPSTCRSIETRFMFHRVPCPLDGVPHLDMLHPARRMWRQRPLATGTPIPMIRAARCRCSRSRSRACIASATCPATRFRRAFSSSSAPAMRGRSKPCSSTTASI